MIYTHASSWWLWKRPPALGGGDRKSIESCPNIHFAPDSCSNILLVTKACISLKAILLYTCSNYDKTYYMRRFWLPPGRPVSRGSTGAPLLILRPPRRYHPHTGKVKVSVCVLVVLPAWNGEVWTVNVVEVSDHTCCQVWCGQWTWLREKMFADLATNCTKHTNCTNH